MNGRILKHIKVVVQHATELKHVRFLVIQLAFNQKWEPTSCAQQCEHADVSVLRKSDQSKGE
jgi:hypothetical protein